MAVWSAKGERYTVRLELEEGEVSCTCMYFVEGKGYCKHINAVAGRRLVELSSVGAEERLRARKIRQQCLPSQTLLTKVLLWAHRQDNNWVIDWCASDNHPLPLTAESSDRR